MNKEELPLAIENCHACSLRSNCTPLPGKLYGEEPPFFFVLQSPNLDEELMREPLYFREGEFLRTTLKDAGIEDYYVTYLTKCVSEASEIKRGHVDICKKWLWQELKFYQPQHLISFGTMPGNLFLKRGLSKSINDIAGHKFLLEYLPGTAFYPWQSLSYILLKKELSTQFKKWLNFISSCTTSKQ